MLKLKNFDLSDYLRYPYVENLGGEIVPRIAQVKMAIPACEGLFATLVVDGNGIQVMIYDADGDQKMVLCRELYPFQLAVFVAEHLQEPLDLEVLNEFGFDRFK